MGRSAGFESRAADMKEAMKKERPFVQFILRAPVKEMLMIAMGVYASLVGLIYLYECYALGRVFWWTHWYSPILDFCPIVALGVWVTLHFWSVLIFEEDETKEKCVT